MGASVTAAGSVEAALRTLESGHPDVVLCDLCMPDRDGFDLIRGLRDHCEHCARLPVAAVTALNPSHETSVLLAGFDRFVQKPIGMEELRETVVELKGTRHV